MKVLEGSVSRLVAVQHLRSAHGIKTKNWNKNKASSSKSTTNSSTKVFAVPLESLPIYNMECGSVPRFLVDACMRLLAHIDTEGLFRKSGSVVRLKALRAKLDLGEECLSAAQPCDVASLVKQFFRDLPEPVFPLELQEAFLKAQQLPTEEDRTSATMLLSCVLPDRNISLLRHFFDFLQNVSKRSAQNKMDISNLSVILAPNLLHFGEGVEKMNANTEKRLKLQAAVIHCFIEHAHDFGVLPQFLKEKVLAMMGCEAGAVSPSNVEVEELASNSRMKKQRRSFGVFSSATPVIATPSSKRKFPLESGHSFGFSNKKRTSVKKNLGIELLPTSLFSGTSTPGSAHSASGLLDSSQITLSSMGRSRRQSATSARRKSRRFSNRRTVHRVESGKAGCFSPTVSKKEALHKSLRLRFSLGKSHKDAGSESIGWRLATQESTTSFQFTKETEFTPSAQHRNTDSKSSKYMSKSEDNLLTPKCESHALQTSWSRESPEGLPMSGGGSFTDMPMNKCLKSNYKSEPVIVLSKPSATSILPKNLCCGSSAESLESERSFMLAQSQVTPTLVKISKAFTASGSDIQTALKDASAGATLTQHSESILPPPPKVATVQALSVNADASIVSIQPSPVIKEQSIKFCKIDIASFSPLHIDSVSFESSVTCSPTVRVNTGSLCVAPFYNRNSLVLQDSEEAEQVNCSRLIDALDIQSSAHFEMGVLSGLRSTPLKSCLQLKEQLGTPSVENAISLVQDKSALSPETTTQVHNLDPLLPHNSQTKEARVADHIRHFNRLTLCSPKRSKTHEVRAPLKFQRTPVQQTICRINSLLGMEKKPTKHSECSSSQSTQMAKSVTLESRLSSHHNRLPTQKEAQVGLLNSICSKKKPVPVPPKKKDTVSYKPAACALGDVTNRVQSKTKMESSLSEPSATPKPLTQQGAEKDVPHYRGSPRNPLTQGCLMSVTKPVNL